MDERERVDLHCSRAVDLWMAGRLELALREIEKALAIAPDHPRSHTVWALCLARRGECGRAVERAKIAVRLDPSDAFPHYALGYCLRSDDRPTEALPHALAALRLDPRYAGAHMLVAHIRADLGDPVEALAAADAAIAIDPADHLSHVCRADVLRRAGRADDALTTAREARSLAPDSFWAHLATAQAAIANRDWRTAAAASGEALRLDPNSTLARCLLLEAMRWLNPAYRIATRTLARFRGLSEWKRVLIVVVLVVCTCGTWSLVALAFGIIGNASKEGTFEPVVDAVLRMDRRSRQLLRPHQILATDRAWAVGLGAVGFVLPLLCCAGPSSVLAGGATGLLLPTMWCVAHCRPGVLRRKFAARVACVLAVAGAGAWFASQADWDVVEGQANQELSNAYLVTLAVLFVVGAVAWHAPRVAFRFGYPWSHRFDLSRGNA